jgi:hypothetical protein
MAQRVYDPMGVVDALAKPLARRVPSLDGLRLGVLDNTKWNAARLLDNVVALLGEDIRLSQINRYKKETFTKPAARELIRDIAVDNDIAVIAIAD